MCRQGLFGDSLVTFSPCSSLQHLRFWEAESKGHVFWKPCLIENVSDKVSLKREKSLLFTPRSLKFLLLLCTDIKHLLHHDCGAFEGIER